MVAYTGPFQVKRATSDVWATVPVPLRPGEIGLDLTVKRIKIGDGSTLFQDLPWATPDNTTIDQLEALADRIGDTVTLADVQMTAVASNPTTAFAIQQVETISQEVTDQASDPVTPIGSVIEDRTRGAAPVLLAKSGPSALAAKPRLIVAPEPLFLSSQSVLKNFYSAQYLPLKGILRSDGQPYAADGCMLYSTNHEGGSIAGCALRFHTGDPRVPANWEAMDRKIFDINNVGTNAEAAQIFYFESRAAAGLPPWLAYVSTSTALGASAQHIKIMQATNIDNGYADWSDTGRRIYLPAKAKGRFPGSGAIGYPKFAKLGQRLSGYVTLGDTDSGYSGMVHSDDGISFAIDPRPLGRDTRWHSAAGGTVESWGVGPSTVPFISRGRRLALLRRSRPASGTAVATLGRAVGFLAEDGRSLVGRPSEVEVQTAAWMGANPVAPLSGTDFGGQILMPVFHNDALGLATLEGVA